MFTLQEEEHSPWHDQATFPSPERTSKWKTMKLKYDYLKDVASSVPHRHETNLNVGYAIATVRMPAPFGE